MKNFPKKSSIQVKIAVDVVRPDDNEDEHIHRVLPTFKGQSKCCVYALFNKQNGNFYIGQTRNIFRRLPRHWRDLAKGIHKSDLMLRDLKKSRLKPEELFECEIILYCRPTELSFYENLLIRVLNPPYNTK